MATTQTKTASKKANKLQAPQLAVEQAQPTAGTKAMEFATQQLTAPVATVQQPTVAPAVDQNSPEFLQALADALANRIALEPKAKQPTAPRARRVEQNGIKRPLAGNGICATMWATFDRISAEQKSPCTIAQAREAMPTFNVVNMQGEYASWRKFNGISGRIVAPQTTAAPIQTEPATTSDVQDSNIL